MFQPAKRRHQSRLKKKSRFKSMIHCNTCGKDMVACDCADALQRLKAVAVHSQAPLVTQILVQRQKLGKDKPASCSKCSAKAEFIPIVKVPARRSTNRGWVHV